MKTVAIIIALVVVFGLLGNARIKRRNRKRVAKTPARRAMNERGSIATRKAEVLDEFKRIYKKLGTDLGRISGDCGESSAPCAKWHGKIISVLGHTAGWPTLADIDAEAVLGGDLPHRIEYVDELLDADEIARQKARLSRRRG